MVIPIRVTPSLHTEKVNRMSKSEPNVTLAPLTPEDREAFILENQAAFLYGATQEFGLRDAHFEEPGEIISRKTIEDAIDGEHAVAYRILLDGEKVGGAVLTMEGDHGDLGLFFISPNVHSKGVGYAAWRKIERYHPEVRVWETGTPYFETRNIHFYVNKCGFHIVEFFNSHHPDPYDPDTPPEKECGMADGFFRFEKRKH